MLKGLDISQFQNVGTGDQAADFVICRASYGVGYTDPNCDAHYQRAKAQGKLLGVYHYAYPQYNSAIDEANWFVSQIQGYIHEAILVLDFEEQTWNVSWAKTFLDRVTELTGVRPLIYLNEYTVNNYDWSSVSQYYGLWLASWYDKFNVPNPPEPTENDFNSNIGSWAFCAIWQYTSSAGKLDRDVAFMTKEGWGLYAYPNKPTEVPVQNPVQEPSPQPNEPKEEPKEEPKNEEPKEVIIPDPVIIKENILNLPQNVYELLRWLNWIVLPYIASFISILNGVWNWGLPMEAITITFGAAEGLIGTVLALTKIGK